MSQPATAVVTMSTTSTNPAAQFKQGACQCCDMGCGMCCFTCCCPCIAYYQAADNISDPNGALYATGSLVGMSLVPGLGCVMLTILGDQVAKKRGIEQDICKSAVCSFFDCCTCYSCSVVAESIDMKNGVAPAVPAKDGMQR